jgi:photosystem II stability/assembly factor-like uncharacterized protein
MMHAVSDPFRDPLDGAVRRAERLEEENEALRREVEALRRERQDEAPKPEPPAHKASPSGARAALSVAGSGIILVSLLVKLAATGHRVTYTPPAPTPYYPPPSALAHYDTSPSVFYTKQTAPVGYALRGAATATDPIAVGAHGTVLVGEKIEPVPTSVTLNGVAAFSVAQGKTSALAVGDEGVILRRNTATPGWTREGSDTTASLRGVTSDGQSSWIVGDRGTVLHQSAPGKAWRAEDARTKRNLTAVTRARSSVLAVGAEGTVLESALDSGAWRSLEAPTSRDLNAVYAADREVWVAGDAGTLLHRDAAGAWSKIPLRRSEALRAVAVLDRLGRPIVVAVGDHGTAVVGEGGRWFEEDAYSDDLFAIGRAGERAFAVGKNGAIVDLRLF